MAPSDNEREPPAMMLVHVAAFEKLDTTVHEQRGRIRLLEEMLEREQAGVGYGHMVRWSHVTRLWMSVALMSAAAIGLPFAHGLTTTAAFAVGWGFGVAIATGFPRWRDKPSA